MPEIRRDMIWFFLHFRDPANRPVNTQAKRWAGVAGIILPNQTYPLSLERRLLPPWTGGGVGVIVIRFPGIFRTPYNVWTGGWMARDGRAPWPHRLTSARRKGED